MGVCCTLQWSYDYITVTVGEFGGKSPFVAFFRVLWTGGMSLNLQPVSLPLDCAGTLLIWPLLHFTRVPCMSRNMTAHKVRAVTSNQLPMPLLEH
jgi:hypothetical protein